jgi:hypothetical protein
MNHLSDFTIDSFLSSKLFATLGKVNTVLLLQLMLFSECLVAALSASSFDSWLFNGLVI